MKFLNLLRSVIGRMEWSRPDALGRLWGAPTEDPRFDRVARVLGARQVIQATITSLRPTRVIMSLGVLVDALHGLSMLGLALIDKRYRRAALTEATLAGTFAGIGLYLVARRRSTATGA